MNRFRHLFAALLVGGLLRVLLACQTPTGFEAFRGGLSWYNDELAHLNYVRHLVEERAFPEKVGSVKAPDAFRRGDFEYYQPPLAYLAQAPAWMLGERIQPGMGWLAARLLEIVFSLLAIAVARSIAHRLAPGTGDAVAWMLALHPGLAYQGTLVSNDPFFWLLAALYLRTVLELPRNGPSWPLFPLAAALFLTKSSAVVLLPLPFLAVTPPLVDDFRPRRLVAPSLALLAGLAAAAPWYLRNLELHHSLLALETGHGAPYVVRDTLHDIPVLKMMTLYFLGSLWYPMDQLTSMRLLPRILESVACAAWVLPTVVEWGRARTSRLMPLLWAALVLGVLAFIPYAIRYRQSEARLLFHLLPAFTALWAISVGPRPTRWTWMALAPCLVAWVVIFGRYAAG
jgi:4-amino-4-deoxy-L-arabinose transferase-like glycosyltransferase